jgi:proline dehydrogenase
MNPLKDLFLFLAKRKLLQNLASTSGIFSKFSTRFVSGETLADGIRVSRDLNTRNTLVTLDHLGESVSKAEEARVAMQEYLEMLDAIAKEKVSATASLKLTQMGLDIGYDLCLNHMRQIMDRAKATHNLVTIDMESSDYTDVTLKVLTTLFKEGFKETGIVIQSYLYRSEKDIRDLIPFGPRVRLCKGTYKEPKSVAFPRKKDVDANYIKLLELMFSPDALAQGTYPEIATHDEKIINWVFNYVKEHNIPRDKFEFQMLYGIRRDLQEKIAHENYRMRVYVPYGGHWYPYYMRRLAERPANLWFIIKSMMYR